MQTYIENVLKVVRNISGIDEAVYSNIYDIELTDKTVFVIIPGDITDNFTAYLVNGSILLMSKVMLVLKSKYIETNMVITSKDNIKEFSLDNCSGVYNVIKFKLIYRREDCGDSYEGMFVKSINGLHGEVFLDIPEKVSDLILDIDYATEEYVNEKIYEIEEGLVKSVNGQKGDVLLDIPERVSDLVQDVSYITEEDADEKYMQKGDVPTDVYTKSEIDGKFVDSSKYTDDTYAKKSSLNNFYTKSDIDSKVSAIDSSIKDVETKIPDVKDFATRDELNSSIANVSSWVSDNYMKKGDVPTDTYNKKEIDDKDADVLILAKGYTEQKVLDLSNYVDLTFATKEEIPTDYVKAEDYNKFVSDQGIINKTQNDAIAANTLDIADINTNITIVDADVKEIENLLDSVNNVIKSNIPATLSLDVETNKLPENILDLIDYKNLVIDDTYARKEDIPDIPDYTDKFNDIDSSISDVSVRIKTIEDNYLIDLDKFELEEKISTVNSNYKAADEALDNKIGANTREINIVSGRVKTIEDSYVKSSDYNEKVSDIDSSISDVSSRLKNVKDVVNSIPENYQEKLVSGTNIKKINGEDILGEGNITIQGGGSSSNHVNITLAEWEALTPEQKQADIVYFITDADVVYATETWVSSQGYLNAADKTELEGQINSKQDAGDYATNTRVNEVEGKIPEVKDFVTNSSISTNYYNKTEIDNKGYLNKVTADGYYQEKGNYVNETVYSNKVAEIDSSISDISTRLKTANDNIANKADLSELANYYTTSKGTALEGRVATTEYNITHILLDIQTLDSKIPTNYVSNSSISTNYYMKKDVYNKEETDGFIGGLRTEISNTYELKGHYDSAISTLNSSVNTLETNILTKQDKLVSGTNIKTINNESILGNGNIEIQGGGGGGTSEHQNITQAEYDALTPELKQADIVYFITDADVVYATQEQVQEVGNSVNTLSGRVETAETEIDNIKNAGYATLTWVSSQGYLNTADKTELEGQINGKQDAGDYALKSEIPDVTGFATKTEVSAKQDTLVSGTNIKTINGNSILGKGNIEIQGGGSGSGDEHLSITYNEWYALSEEEKMSDKVYLISDADLLLLTNVMFSFDLSTKTLTITPQ